MKKSAREMERRTCGRGSDLSFGINGSTDQITDQMRRRTHAEIINGGKVANDETAHAWRDAA